MLRARTAVLAALLTFAFAAAAHAAVGGPVPGELIVKYKLGTGAATRAQALARVPDAQPLRELSIINAQQVRFTGMSMAEAIARLRQDPAVVYAEPNYEIHLDRVPNDPRFGELYAMRNLGQTGGTPGADIRATSAWDLFTGDGDVKVGVIDTGIDFNHPDLAANIWTNPGEIAGNGIDDDHNGYVDDIHGYDVVNNDGSPMDDHGHGTHCSGTIAGVGDNGIGVAGVSWHCKLVGIKFLDSGGSGTTAGAIRAVQYAVAVGVRLTSNSWGGGEFSTALFDAIQAAGASGQLFVAAAGNSGSDNDLFPHYPSSYNSPYIIAVAATDANDALAGFSCFGRTSVDLAAPGVSILSTFPGASYNTLSGTSMATPHVSGAVAMIMGRFPLATNLQVRDILFASTDSIPALAGRTVTGGRLNLFRAIQLPDSLPPASVADLAIDEAGSTAISLTWTVPADDGFDGRAAGYDLRWSVEPIDESNFATAHPVATPLALGLGQTEHFEVTGLSPDTHYWFALRALDRVGNASALSNVADAITLGVPAMALEPAAFSAALRTGGSVSFPLTVRNTGAGRLDFTAPAPEQFVAVLQAAAGSGGDPEAAFDRTSAGPRPGTVGASGPDAGGYRWSDSDRSGGPAFEWVDLAGRGVPVVFANASTLSQPVELGFEFPYYGQRFRTVRVSANGYLTFTGSSSRSANTMLPDAGAQGDLVAPLWDELVLGAQGTVESSREDGRFVVTFRALAGREPADGLNTFQVVLYPSGEIRYQYLTLGAARGGATIGLQASGRAVGSLVAFNTPYVHDRQTIQFLPVQQWLQISPVSGRVAAGASTQVTVRFDATGLGGGDLLGNVIINSNAPASPRVLLPATLHVTAAPDVVTVPDSLLYAPLFIGAERVQQLSVRNRGTAPLQISGISVSSSDFIAPASGVTLLPDSTLLLPVAFRPSTAGPITGVLTVHSDDPDSPDHAVVLEGTGLVPPDVALAPDSVLASLFVGGTATRTMTITNSGGSDLDFRLSARRPAGPAAPSGAPIVAPESQRVASANRLHAGDAAPAIHAFYTGEHMAFGVSTLGEVMPFQSPLGVEHLQAGTYLSGYTVAYVYGGSLRLAYAVFSNQSNIAPQSYRELENSASRVVVEVTSATLDGVLQVVRTITFERAGHGVRVETQLRNISGVALTDVVYKEDVDWDADGSFPNQWDYDRSRNMVFASKIHFVGIGSDRTPDFMDLDGWDDFARSATTVGFPTGPIQELDGLALLHFGIGSLAAGEASTVAVAYGAGNTLAELQAAIDANASSVSWLSFEPRSGRVAAGQSLQVAAQFKTDGLLDGDYLADIVLDSNDPDEPSLRAGARLHVTGAADIASAPESLDFGYLFAGASKSDTLIVRNAGTATLVVSGVSASSAAFIVPTAGFTLIPGAVRRIPVRFSPAIRGDFGGMVTFTSNDPDEAAFAVAVHGFGRVPPDIQLPLDSLVADLITGESRVHTLQLSNTGGGELFWDATIGPRTVLEATPVFGGSAPTQEKHTLTSAPPVPAKNQQYRAAVPSAALPAPLYPAEAALANNSLESTLAKLDAGAASIVAAVPNSFPFSEGVIGNSIGDGGLDMYDGGNFLSTPLGGLNYSDGVIQASPAFGTGGRYFTRKYPGLFVLAAEMQDVASFDIAGNLGADGFGNVDGSILQIRAADATYRAFVKRVFNAGDPSVNHMVIVADDPGATHAFALYTDDDFHQVTGLAPARRLYYLLYAGTGGSYINDDQAMQVFATFLRILDPQPTWLRIEPSAGVVSPGGRATLRATMNSSGLGTGDYLSELRVHSDDPDETDLVVAARLHVTGAPDIAVAPTRLDFPPMFVGLTREDSVTVSNDGSDPLTVTGVTSDAAEFLVPATGFTLAAGARRVLPVRFVPTSPGTKSGTLRVASDDHDEPVLSVALTGEGLVPPGILTSPDSLVASLLTGDTLSTDLFITNPGGSALTFDLAPEFLNSAAAVAPAMRLANLQAAVPALSAAPWPGASSEGRSLEGMGSAVVRAGVAPDASGRVLVIATAPVTRTIERALGEMSQPYDIVFTTNFGAIDYSTYRTIVVGMDGGLIEPAALQALATAASAGRNLIMMGGTSYPPFYTGMQSHLLQHTNVQGWFSSPTPHLSVVAPGDPLAVGLPSTVNFVDFAATFHALRISDPAAAVVAVNGSGSPALIRKRIGAGSLVYFTNSPYEGWWSFEQDYQVFRRVLENAVRAPSWLSFSPASGTVAPGGTQRVGARFDPGSLLGGDYTASVLVRTNVPTRPQVEIPAHLHVTGAPDITVIPLSIAFPTLLLGTSALDSIVVRNDGTDVLSVASVSLAGAEFTVPTSGFTLTPGAGRVLPVRFVPVSPGAKSATVELASNDHDEPLVVVTLSGSAIPAPVIGAAPDSLVASLFTGDTLLTDIEISNSGGSPLTFEMSPSLVNSLTVEWTAAERLAQLQASVPAIVPGAWPGAAPPGRSLQEMGAAVVRASVGADGPGRTLVLATNDVRGTVERALIEFGFPYDLAFTDNYTGIDFTPYHTVIVGLDGGLVSKASVLALANAAASGRRLVILGGTDYGPFYDGMQTYLLHHTNVSGWSTSPAPHLTITAPSDPLVKGLPASVTFVDFSASYHSLRINDPAAVVAARNGLGVPALVRKPIGAGSLVYFISDPYTYFWTAPSDYAVLRQILLNALNLADWISFSPTSGSVAPGAVAHVTARFDPGQLFGGDYLGTADIRSNDPVRPIVRLPVHMHLTGAPNIVATPEPMLFPTLFIGQSRTDTLTIRNSGTDALAITSITSDDPDYTAPGSAFTLAPGTSRVIPVRFAPLTAGAREATLHIASNDPDQPVTLIRLIGAALLAPLVELTPDSLAASLFAADSLEAVVTLRNGGGSALVWTGAPASASVLSESPVLASVPVPDGKTLQPSPGRTPDAAHLWSGPAPASPALRSAGTPEPSAPASTLAGILANLNARAGLITAIIPGRYDFFEGETGTFIADGGNDMYDVGNFLNTELGNLGYTNGTIIPSPVLGPTGRYFTRKFPGLFVLGAELDGTNVFMTSGNLGADGFGNVDGAVLQTTRAGTVYRAFVKRVFNAFNPSVNHMIIVVDAPGASHSFATSSDDDFHQVAGLGGSRRLYYLLYAGQSGGYINNTTAAAIFEKFLEVADPSPAWLTATPLSGNLAPGAQQDIRVKFASSTLAPGDYRGSLNITSNDPFRPLAAVPAHLHVIGTPRVAVDPVRLDFGQLLVGATKTDSLRVSNPGTDVLHVSGVSNASGRFTVPGAAFDLAPGASRVLRVTLSPNVPEVVVDELDIASNDASTPHLIVPLTATVLPAPLAAVAPDSLVFALAVGGTASAPLTLTNAGDGPLHYTAFRGPAVLASSPAATVVPEAISRHARFPEGSPPPVDSSPLTLAPSISTVAPSASSTALVIADGGTETDVGAILSAAGYTVTMVADDGVWNGSNPSPDGFGLVVLLDGPGVGNDMPLAGQNALNAYVQAGGGLLALEWAAFEAASGRYVNLRPLLPISWGEYADGTFACRVVTTHPVTSGVTSTFNVTTTADVGTLNSGRALVVNATGAPMVAVKDVGAGRVVHFATAGNYFGFRPFASLDMQRLLVNAANFLSGSNWLTIAPASSIVAPHSSVVLTVTADATLLTAGTQRASVQIITDDPLHPMLVVPVRADVSAAAVAAAAPDTTAAARDRARAGAAKAAAEVRLALHGLTPNPPVRELTVSFSLPDASPATLELLDLAGRRVRSVEVGTLGAGRHTVALGERHGLPSGVYLVRLRHSGRSLVAKGVLVE